MIATKELLLLVAVAAVGVLHTVVPDHWVPITLLARQRGWGRTQTARAALGAGAGHVLSTLLIAFLAAIAGLAIAARFGGWIDALSSLALVVFGAVIAISAWRETARPAEEAPLEDALYLPLAGGGESALRHSHSHRHGTGRPHSHWHDHDRASTHPPAAGVLAQPPLHEHRHPLAARSALILILGSSPMIEGIPAFFAAAKYGASLLAAMALVFAIGTISTYVGLSLLSLSGLERVHLGPLERYGEVLSGGLIALLGVLFAFLPRLSLL